MATKATQRKVLAVLAGGLVLGVGTAVTLAAWNDSEFANGTFTAGAFNLQGSTDGTAYADHDSAGSAATLAFTLPAGLVGNMSPTSSVYAGFWVRRHHQRRRSRRRWHHGRCRGHVELRPPVVLDLSVGAGSDL
ncbi:SipW-dependent-type signal peptide-containing protein [Microbacterium maritypicum]|uniref:SipW-cognate class signal peptide n=1 Tax=Microbacterium maritypicum TaxID=33918 RepID=A0A4Y4B415_MICMQ|nr:SipW-dependent-type signal peptide-containing protein [Microbacterium liquefaciens]GEC74299.1 hypothetical protein MLI01_04440 [Microbacterium liquefaciens]GGV50323.1 hypothetical protein GCM10010213_04450 [Microbacterium liquefaciens]